MSNNEILEKTTKEKKSNKSSSKYKVNVSSPNKSRLIDGNDKPQSNKISVKNIEKIGLNPPM